MANWTNNEFVNSLLFGSKVANSPINYFLDNTAPAGAWTPTEVAAFAAAFQTWSNVANITFTRVFSVAEAHFVERRFDTASLGGAIDAPLADHEIPALGWDSPTIIPVTLGPGHMLTGRYNTDAAGWNDAALLPGGDAMQTIVHELGHGLGLDHTHRDDAEDPHVFPGG